MSVKNAITKTKKKIWQIADKKLPIIWDPNQEITSYWLQAFSQGFANQGTSWPIRWILGTALWTTIGLWVDAVNIPYQWLKGLYNTGAELYNAQVSKRKAKKMKNAVTAKQ